MTLGSRELQELVRTIVEECWTDAAGLDRLEGLLADGYVHHTPFGDWTFEQFREGIAWVESQLGDRTYRVLHVVVEGDLAAAYIVWTATRRADGTAVEGRGAYHCRITAAGVHEDWDVFYPAG